MSRLNFLLLSLWKYRWAGLVSAWLTALIGNWFLVALPQYYDSSALIKIEQTAMKLPALEYDRDPEDYRKQLKNIILTQEVLNGILHGLESAVLPANLSLEQQASYARHIYDNIIIEPSLKITNAYFVKYRHATSEKIATASMAVIVPTIITFLQIMNQDKKESPSVSLTEQIEATEQRLKLAEYALNTASTRNANKLGNNQNQLSQDTIITISDLNQKIFQAQTELQEAENAKKSAQKQIASQTQSAKNTASEHTQNKQVLEQLKNLLNETEVNAVEIRNKIKAYEQRLQEIKMANQPNVTYASGNDTEMVKLKKEYDTVRRQYEQLLSQRNLPSEAPQPQVLAPRQETVSLIEKFPAKLAAPNKFTLSYLLAISSLLIGFLVMCFESYTCSSFDDAESLMKKTGAQVIGSVSLVQHNLVSSTNTLHKNRYFFICFGLLLGTLLASIIWTYIVTYPTHAFV